MKRPRPYIPLAVRCLVALRQIGWTSDRADRRLLSEDHYSGGNGHAWLLDHSLATLAEQLGCEQKDLHLDHDPALVLRKFNHRTGKYSPDANHPDYLIYREKADHQQKTTGRKPGAERTITTKGSDIGLKTKFARLERKAAKSAKMRMTAQRKRKEKRKIQSRSFSTEKRKFR
jgi:hypothetical protein